MSARKKGEKPRGSARRAGGKALPFEKRLARLEEIVENLEAGEVPLEKSLGLYEEGLEHLRACHLAIDEAERKIRAVVRGRGGLRAEPFAPPEDDEGADEA